MSPEVPVAFCISWLPIPTGLPHNGSSHDEEAVHVDSWKEKKLLIDAMRTFSPFTVVERKKAGVPGHFTEKSESLCSGEDTRMCLAEAALEV